MAITEDQIRKTMDLLTTWNPLGDRAMTIGDLDNYRTEAIDILFHLRLVGSSFPISYPYSETFTKILKNIKKLHYENYS